MPNKEQTMITTLEQHCGKCLDAIIIGSIIQCSMICFLILVAIAIVIKIDKKKLRLDCTKVSLRKKHKHKGFAKLKVKIRKVNIQD